jgi:hypothetical protein
MDIMLFNFSVLLFVVSSIPWHGRDHWKPTVEYQSVITTST